MLIATPMRAGRGAVSTQRSDRIRLSCGRSGGGGNRTAQYSSRLSHIATTAGCYVDQRVLIDSGANLDRCKSGGVQERHQLVAVPLAHGKCVLLAPTVNRLRAERHMDAAVIVVDGVDAAGQRDLFEGRFAPVPYAPAELALFIVKDERPARQKGIVQSSECLDVLLAGAAETEDAAAYDR